jgi:uncharacterized phage-associated protein
MPYLKLLKLLYIAEREFLVEESEMMFGDRVVAMKYGPVLSHVYRLIKNKGRNTEQWRECIRNATDYSVELYQDPGFGNLCRAEMEKLDDVFRRYGNMNQFLAVEMTHDFPEWANNYDTNSLRKAFPISVEDILSCQDKADLIAQVRERQEEIAHYEKLFGTQS